MRKFKYNVLYTVVAVMIACVLTLVSACTSADVTKPVPPAQQTVLTDMTVKSAPVKTSYTVGEELDVTGATVTLVYSDGSSSDKAVTSDMVGGYDGTHAGVQYITVTYGEDGVTRKAVFAVTVTERAPSSEDPPSDDPDEDYIFSFGDEYCWNITEDNGKASFESTSSTQYLMFNKLRFTGGSVSFKIKVDNNDLTYAVADGIVFGADTLDVTHDNGRFYVCGRDKWNEYLTFSKDNGAFKWQDSTKVTGALAQLDVTYALKFVWDSAKDLVYYFIDGEYVGKQQLDKGFKGEYIGLYADHPGVTISDIVIDENETFEVTNETEKYMFTEGDSTSWKITGEGGTAAFESKRAAQMLMFKTETFSGGSVSFRLKDTDNNYTSSCVTGIVFGSNSVNATHATGSFYLVGRDRWNDLVMCSRDGGAFMWQDSTKIAGGLNVLGKTYDIKFVWDSGNDVVYYFIDGMYLGEQQLNKGFKGAYMGIYADSPGAVISDIVIDETETFTPPRVVTETEDYLFTEGDSRNWKITENGGTTEYRAMKNSQYLMFKNKTFSGGSVSFKLTCESNEFTYSVASGIVFASDIDNIGHNAGKFYVCGRDKWNDFLVFSKDNGTFMWQDSTKIAGALNEVGKTYALKFIWDSEKDIVYYFIDGKYVGMQQLNKGFNGEHIGIYADCAGTVISDIVIDEAETFTPEI